MMKCRNKIFLQGKEKNLNIYISSVDFGIV